VQGCSLAGIIRSKYDIRHVCALDLENSVAGLARYVAVAPQLAARLFPRRSDK
jgi:hypothetical protein